MDEIVNSVGRVKADAQYAGVVIELDGDRVRVAGPAGSSCLRLVRLYRPSSGDIEREAAPDVLLVLIAASAKAAQSAARHNHIFVPGNSYRIVAPGVALVREGPMPMVEVSRQVRLTGRTGVLAETLLTGGRKEWSVRELAAASQASSALAHRALTRLEREGLVTSHAYGPEKARVVADPRALAELWSQEEKTPKLILRGFLYATSPEALARKVVEVCPGGAVGGTLAANLYRPVLTRVPPPVLIWAPADFAPNALGAIGFERTDAGANLEFVQAKENPWRVHMSSDSPPRVSRWRAWLEIAQAEGRTQELAEALLSDLLRSDLE